jgi:hypothetical protein
VKRPRPNTRFYAAISVDANRRQIFVTVSSLRTTTSTRDFQNTSTTIHGRGYTVASIAVDMQTMARRNIRCLVTAGKHVNNSQAIARELLSKRVPAATDTHGTAEVLLDFNNENVGFYVVRAEIF